MKRFMLLAALAAALVLASGSAVTFAQTKTGGQEPAKKQDKDKKKEKKPEEAVKADPVCPISGRPVNFAVSMATDEGPVFFCCRACIKTYAADTAKYADKIATQHKALRHQAKVQVRCPVDLKAVSKDISVKYRGRDVHFCSEECKSTFVGDTKKYNKALANSYTYQPLCPVEGSPIDPKELSILPTGETVHFCSATCRGKFLTDPEKFSSNLEKHGFKLDVEALRKALKKGR